MKTKFTTICFILSLISNVNLIAQLPVSTLPQNKKVVLEEFTGIHCGACPYGHLISENIYNSDPNNVILINIHHGSVAVPFYNEPDFQTSDGNAIAAMPGMGVSGYPEGAINRTIFTGSVMAMSPNDWSTYANVVKTQTAYCNVAIQGTLNAQTRVLTVQAEVYYTANSPQPTNYLTIALLENDIPGPQSDFPGYNPTNYFPDGNYKHKHVLRKIITPTFGTPVSPTTAGSLYSSTFTYTVPYFYPSTGTNTTTCLLGRLELVAFVTETNSITINAARGPIFINNITFQRDIAVNNLTTEDEVCFGGINPKFWFINYGSDTVTNVTFTYSINGNTTSTITWTGTCMPYTQDIVVANNINFSPNPNTNTLQIGVLNVNNNPDQNASNNTTSKTIPTTTLISPGVNMQMDFYQDQYGSEIRWKVIDESNGNIVAQDGKWSDLPSIGTLLHTKTFTLTNNNCYKLIITDDFGDGACCYYGNGSYDLKCNGNSIFSGPANYGQELIKWFKTDNNAFISNNIQFTEIISIYPNPANEKIHILLNPQKESNFKISIINTLGQLVYTSNEKISEKRVIEINTQDFNTGLYHILISNENNSFSKTISITR
jgi:hypothetical protein